MVPPDPGAGSLWAARRAPPLRHLRPSRGKKENPCAFAEPVSSWIFRPGGGGGGSQPTPQDTGGGPPLRAAVASLPPPRGSTRELVGTFTFGLLVVVSPVGKAPLPLSSPDFSRRLGAQGANMFSSLRSRLGAVLGESPDEATGGGDEEEPGQQTDPPPTHAVRAG
jgi:hypothetical protein